MSKELCNPLTDTQQKNREPLLRLQEFVPSTYDQGAVQNKQHTQDPIIIARPSTIGTAMRLRLCLS